MDSAQIRFGSQLCAVMLGVTIGSMSPSMAASESARLLNIRHEDAKIWQPRYAVSGFHSSSQGTQKVIGATLKNSGLDNFFDGFGRNLEDRQVSLSPDDQRLIWDNLDELLS